MGNGPGRCWAEEGGMNTIKIHCMHVRNSQRSTKNLKKKHFKDVSL